MSHSTIAELNREDSPHSAISTSSSCRSSQGTIRTNKTLPMRVEVASVASMNSVLPNTTISSSSNVCTISVSSSSSTTSVRSVSGSSKVRWSEDDLRKLATAELNAPESVRASINEFLYNTVSLGVRRGFDAIKSIRRRDKYRQLLSDLRVQGVPVLDPVTSETLSPSIVVPSPSVLRISMGNTSDRPTFEQVHVPPSEQAIDVDVRPMEVSSRSSNNCPTSTSQFQCQECVRSFPSARSLSQHKRHAHRDAIRTEAHVDRPLLHHCTLCQRNFISTIALGQHKRHAHPVENNNDIVLASKKTRWNDEDLRRLISAEIKAGPHRSKDINIYLESLNIVSRSAEAIMNMRRSLRYKNLRAEMEACLSSPQEVSPIVSASPVSQEAIQISSSDDSISSSGSLTSKSSVESFRNWLRLAKDALTNSNTRVSGYDEILRAIDAVLQGIDPESSLMMWFSAVFPDIKRYKPRKSPNNTTGTSASRSQLRRREYARLQTLWRKNRSKAARLVLDGDKSTASTLSLEVQQAFWRPIFESVGEQTIPVSSRASRSSLLDDICAPIEASDILRIRPKLRSSPGPDGLSARDWISKVDPVVAASVMNIILLWGHVPAVWRDSRTILIPKKEGAQDPALFRPISISSVVLRHLHRILADRVISSDMFDKRQRGFIHADGTAENVAVLAAILDKARHDNKNIHIVSIDAQKAFDTVSHEAIDRVLFKRGFSDIVSAYFKNLYKESFTQLEVDGALSSRIHPARGVRQGDPFSSVAFNLIMDEVLEAVDPQVGFDLDGARVNALSFADDLDLVASTSNGMQSMLHSVAKAMATHGLTPAPSKCSAVSLMLAGKVGKMKAITEPLFRINGHPIRQIGVDESWRHLGVSFTIKGPASPVINLKELLDKTTKAPLKPQQRLVVLRFHLIPRFMHCLVLGKVSFGLLNRMDRTVRSYVRRWTKLPQDVPCAFFHAPVNEGGLGIMSFTSRIPELVVQRVTGLRSSNFICVQKACTGKWAEKRVKWTQGQNIKHNDWPRKLHQSVDGSELKQCRGSPLSYSWLYASTGIPPRDWLAYLKVRINALPSRVRTTRGIRALSMDRNCRAHCMVTETTAHIIQQCHRTHGGRILRHNAIVMYLANLLHEKRYRVWVEPHFMTSAGLRKPDLVVERDGIAFIIDAQIVSGSGDLQLKHVQKRDYYSLNTDLLSSVADLTGLPRSRVQTTTLTISWRGVWASSSAAFMLGLGLSKRKLLGITTRVLLGSYLNFVRFNSMTTMASHNLWPCRLRVQS